MDAISAATQAPGEAALSPEPDSTLMDRFRASMTIDYEKWHDGIG